jgi:hypothetical protein
VIACVCLTNAQGAWVARYKCMCARVLFRLFRAIVSRAGLLTDGVARILDRSGDTFAWSFHRRWFPISLLTV